MESTSIVVEIPNDAFTTLSRKLIGCSTPSQDSIVLQADWLILENNEKTTLNITYPILTCFKQSITGTHIE